MDASAVGLTPWQRTMQTALLDLFVDHETKENGILWSRPLGRYVLVIGVLPSDKHDIDAFSANLMEMVKADGRLRLTQYKRVISVLPNPETPPAGRELWEFAFEAVLSFDHDYKVG